MGYVQLGYKPRDDLVCEFSVEPAKGLTMRQAAERLAAESSVGTWTEISTMKPSIAKKLGAKVFFIRGNCVRVAYPSELFETNNVPQILSSIAGNVFGMKDVENLRLEDVSFPKSMLNAFKGPAYGINGIRKMMKVPSRPLVGTIIKPKLGLSASEHARVAYEAWSGGCDVVKDDENLSSQRFNPFEDRIVRTLEKCDRAEQETGEKKTYLANVTAETEEMLRRAQFVEDHGGKHVMFDILTGGFSALQTLRDSNFKLAIHAHRAMHAALTRNPKHGISMMVVADFVRLIGVDQLHIGAAIGKMEGPKKEVVALDQEIEARIVKPGSHTLEQDWHHIKPAFAVCSGGLYPGHIPPLVKMLGKNIIVQMGGGIHGHPNGTRAGATAARQAVDAATKGVSLREYSKTHKELKLALEHWEQRHY